ncbi:class I SAM-dependent methyltransferase [Aureimonas populi]|uniref:Class I SAM-dependent methyltransferase n=1 Tax=Aureimonas populi TaxID=1701758 RepID=A0ABW5CIX0_9HYPH|nr:class I SAM-dependent methyltransferase [Aureimonas populi]
MIDAHGFEAKFARDPDPWNYAASPFEAHKRRMLLRACGPSLHGRTLELACANGETTKVLAKRSLRVLGVDASGSALAEARRRLAGNPRVTLRQALLPAQMPRGPFDLVVVSELLYYLPARQAHAAIRAILHATAPGGRIVLLHHVVDFDDAAQKPWVAQQRGIRALARKGRLAAQARGKGFHMAAFVKRRG